MKGILPNDVANFRGSVPGDALDPAHPVSVAINDMQKRLRLKARCIELASMLNDLPGFYEIYTRETQKAYGTENTRATYKSDFERYRTWCAENDLPAIPATPEVLSHYLLNAAGDGVKPDRLQRTVSAVRYYQEWVGGEPPCDDILVKSVLNWARRHWNEEQNKEIETAATLPSANNGAGQH
jgi:hypothetical protein